MTNETDHTQLPDSICGLQRIAMQVPRAGKVAVPVSQILAAKIEYETLIQKLQKALEETTKINVPPLEWKEPLGGVTPEGIQLMAETPFGTLFIETLRAKRGQTYRYYSLSVPPGWIALGAIKPEKSVLAMMQKASEWYTRVLADNTQEEEL